MKETEDFWQQQEKPLWAKLEEKLGLSNTAKKGEGREKQRERAEVTFADTSSFEFFPCARSRLIGEWVRQASSFSCRPFYLISKSGELARRKAIFARGLTPANDADGSDGGRSGGIVVMGEWLVVKKDHPVTTVRILIAPGNVLKGSGGIFERGITEVWHKYRLTNGSSTK